MSQALSYAQGNSKKGKAKVDSMSSMPGSGDDDVDVKDDATAFAKKKKKVITKKATATKKVAVKKGK